MKNWAITRGNLEKLQNKFQEKQKKTIVKIPKEQSEKLFLEKLAKESLAIFSTEFLAQELLELFPKKN